ncbi:MULTISPECIES: hypothetical protein [Streptomyces]|uniref:Integral membrane protein n=1 Tax=Streptomyces bobili TaxID=67280 RepID=A0ABZ1R5H4_9ACTN|nr:MULTISPECIES: hypothetical protein [Streptomyces]QEU65561.1 hypothetical protein CP966_09915 [Streptomyces galilaeus]GGW26899.1 hypothetical protein GCM10010350_07570 [Streptomyces galilaeus]
MGTVVLSGTAVLVVLGFGNHLYWLAAVAVLYLYARHGRGSSSTPSGPAAGSPQGPTPTPAPTSYKAYRARRDQQAKWERRYARERGTR